MSYWNKKLPEWTYNLPPAHFINDNEPPRFFKESGVCRGAYRKGSQVNSPWIKTTIGKNTYYGKSLEGKHWKKTKTIIGKIIPLFAVSIFLAPISIPLFFATGTYRKLGVWIREIHYNSTIDYKIKAVGTVALNPNQAPSLVSDPFIDLLPRIQQSAYFNSDEESRNFFNAIQCVSKKFISSSTETELSLINSGKLLLKDIPKIKNKGDALAHILKYGPTLKLLDISDFKGWTDSDLKDIATHCPNLETFIMKRTVALDPLAEIGKLTKLKKLHLGGQFHGKDVIQCTSLDNLINLEDLKLDTVSAVPSLDKLTNLRKLTLIDCQGPVPSLDNQYKLSKLIATGIEIPSSFDGLMNLRKLKLNIKGLNPVAIPQLNKLLLLNDLTLSTSDLRSVTIPQLNELINLEKLSISDRLIDAIDLHPSAPIEALLLRCPSLKSFPVTDSSKLKTLIIKNCTTLNNKLNFKNELKRYTELKEYRTDIDFNLHSDQLNHLEKLEAKNLYSKNAGWLIPKNIRKNLKLLHVAGNDSLIANFDDFDNLEILALSNLDNTVIPPFDHMSKLKKLWIMFCDNLKRVPSLKQMTSLSHLGILYCENLKIPLSNKLENLKYLEILESPMAIKKLKLETLIRLEEAYINLAPIHISLYQESLRKAPSYS